MKEVGRGSLEGPTRQGRALGGCPYPHEHLVALLTEGPSLLDLVRSKNHVPEGFILFGLRLIFLFFKTLK